MAEVTKDVKARLAVETDGEPQAISDAAAAVKELQGAAAASEPSLAGLTDQLTELGGKVKELGPAGEAFERFAQALRQLGKSKDVEEQRKAVEAALKAWKEFGSQVPEVLDKSSRAAKEYQQTLEALEERHRRLSDPLAESSSKAEQAMAKLVESTEDGFEGVEGKVERVRHALNEYRAALQASGDAGAGAAEEEIAKLQQLEAEYDKALAAVGRYRAAKQEAQRDIEAAAAATGNEVKSISDLGDVASAASPKLAKMVGTAGLIVGAFTAGYAAGEKLRNVLNSLTDGAFDRFIQKSVGVEAAAGAMERALNLLAGGADNATRRLEELSNQRRVFEALGLDGFSNDVERNAEILAQHGRAVHEANALWEEFAKKVGLSRVELAQQSDELVRQIAAFEKANPQIDPKVFQSLIKEQIQPLLDAYARLGVEAPQALRALAAEWSVTTSKAEADAKRHADLVRSLVDQITGSTTSTAAELREVAAAVSEAIASINFAELSPEGLERARLEVQAILDAFRAAKVEIPQSLAEAASKVGLFVAAMETAGGVIPGFTAANAAAADSAARLQVNTDGVRKSVEDFAQSSVRMAQDVETGRVAIESVNPVAGEAQISLDELKAKYGATGKAAKEAGADVAAGTKEMAQGADTLGKATVDVDSAGDSMGYAADQAKAAAPALSAAGEGAQQLGQQAGAAQQGVGGLADESEELSQRLDQLKTALVATVQGVTEAIGRIKGFSAPILAELDELVAGARQAHAEILALGDGGDTGAAPPPGPQASH